MSNGSPLFGKAAAAVPHLINGPGGVAAEVAKLRSDTGTVLNKLAALTVDEFTNAAAAAAAGLAAATATTVAPKTITAFIAGGVTALATYARNITFTTAGGTVADAPPSALVTGTYLGKAQTETINLSQSAGVATGTKPFSTVTSVAYAAADGTGATVSIGFGASLGLGQVIKSRAGLVEIIREIAIGAVVTSGTITAVGLYTPASAPDGVKDYAVYYEYDPAA